MRYSDTADGNRYKSELTGTFSLWQRTSFKFMGSLDYGEWHVEEYDGTNWSARVGSFRSGVFLILKRFLARPFSSLLTSSPPIFLPDICVFAKLFSHFRHKAISPPDAMVNLRGITL